MPVGLLDIVCRILFFLFVMLFFFFCLSANIFIHFIFLLDCDEFRQDEFSFGNRGVAQGGDREGALMSKMGSSSTTELRPKIASQSRPTSMPPASVMTRLILIMVWRKLIRNPNTYSSLIGLTWSLVSFKYDQLSFLSNSLFFCYFIDKHVVIVQVGG